MLVHILFDSSFPFFLTLSTYTFYFLLWFCNQWFLSSVNCSHQMLPLLSVFKKKKKIPEAVGTPADSLTYCLWITRVHWEIDCPLCVLGFWGGDVLWLPCGQAKLLPSLLRKSECHTSCWDHFVSMSLGRLWLLVAEIIKISETKCAVAGKGLSA